MITHFFDKALALHKTKLAKDAKLIALRFQESNTQSAILSVCLCVYVSVCFNCSKTARGTSIKLNMIDDHTVVSVIKVCDIIMTS